MPFEHESVRHSAGEYVQDMAHTNGIESFWSMLKRAHKGVYHKMSAKHLQRYVNEFSGRHGIRELGIRLWCMDLRISISGSASVFESLSCLSSSTHRVATISPEPSTGS